MEESVNAETDEPNNYGPTSATVETKVTPTVDTKKPVSTATSNGPESVVESESKPEPPAEADETPGPVPESNDVGDEKGEENNVNKDASAGESWDGPLDENKPVIKKNKSTELKYKYREPAGLPKLPDVILDTPISNKWKRNSEIAKTATPDDTGGSKTEDLYKKVNAILNKLTPQKFQTLIQQVLDLEIDTEERIAGCIDIIFEKAISEPNFNVAYGKMCKYMINMKVPSKDKPEEFVTFKRLLLNRCQKEFEKDKVEENDMVSRRQTEIDEAPEDKKNQLIKEKDNAEATAKRRSLGNIRFIGELFKLKMLTENIMHDCLLKLLRSNDEHHLECLCILFSTIGKDIDVDRAKMRVDQYFAQVDKIIKQKRTCGRVRFMLQDTIELRKNKWVRNHRGGRGGGGSNASPSPLGDDGWQSVGRANRNTIDPSNNPKTIEQIHREEEKPQPSTPAIRFLSAVRVEIYNARRKDRESALAVRNIASGGTCRTQSGNRQASGSRNQSKVSSRNRDIPKEESKPAVIPKELSEAEIEKKTKAIMYEYLNIHDLKEAILYVKELDSPKCIQLFVYHALSHVLERSSQSRTKAGILLHDLVKSKVLTVDQYIRGLKEILEYADDMEIHVPEIWQNLGEMISPMVQDGSVPLSFLKEVCEPLKRCNKASILVAEMLKDASHRLGHATVGDQWKQSGLQWSDFLSQNENVAEFIKKHKLEFNEARSPEGTSLPMDMVQKELDKLLIDKKTTNGSVFDWIDANVGETRRNDPRFIRALMTSVCSAAIQGQGSRCQVQQDQIAKRTLLLQKYLDHKADLELQALYALQVLVHKLDHPAGVLRCIFDTLYDEDIISEDAFNQWEQNLDPAEQAGKGVALTSVLQFFTWLREAEEEDQEY